MIFLPVAQRELRAASRRRSTFRVRWWTALLALVITFGSLVAVSLSAGGRGVGTRLFSVLTAYAFLICLLAGVLLTADALAREKREGTLGLLFLTDLKGQDIVLGKFLAHSLNAFYALLAMLPATALPLLLGGVEGAEFFRMAIALINTLFVSLAAGIFVSVFTRESQNALGNGLGLVLLLTAVLPILSAGLNWVGAGRAWQALAWLSPFFAFTHSTQSSYIGREQAFWAALLLAHVVGWLFLGVASLVLPGVFQDKPAGIRVEAGAPATRLGSRPRKPRPQLLAENPVLWLRSAELGTPWLAWAAVLVWGVVAVCVSFIGGGGEFSVILIESARPFGFFLKLLFAVQTCRFFVDARLSGTLEMLLCTPLSNQDIIRGQMKALFRAFGPPILILSVLLFLPILIRIGIGLFHPGSDPAYSTLGGGFFAGVFSARMVADVLAIFWFGTALALTSRRPGLAPVGTILFVLILPSLLSFCWVDILIDLVFISWGTNKCRMDLRRLAAEQYSVLSQPPRSLGGNLRYS